MNELIQIVKYCSSPFLNSLASWKDFLRGPDVSHTPSRKLVKRAKILRIIVFHGGIFCLIGLELHDHGILGLIFHGFTGKLLCFFVSR
jgi:hypothetical protein